MSKERKHRPTGPDQRMLRVGEIVRHALAEIFARSEIIDDDLSGAVISVPEVRMSPDLKLANAYIAALNRHQRFIRGRLAPAIDLKFSPELRFFVDETFDQFGKIEALLKTDRVQRDLHAEEDGDKDSD